MSDLKASHLDVRYIRVTDVSVPGASFFFAARAHRTYAMIAWADHFDGIKAEEILLAMPPETEHLIRAELAGTPEERSLGLIGATLPDPPVWTAL